MSRMPQKIAAAGGAAAIAAVALAAAATAATGDEIPSRFLSVFEC